MKSYIEASHFLKLELYIYIYRLYIYSAKLRKTLFCQLNQQSMNSFFVKELQPGFLLLPLSAVLMVAAGLCKETGDVFM